MFALTQDPAVIAARLHRRLGRMELFAMLFCLAMCGVFIWLHTLGRVVLYDFGLYIHTAGGDFTFFYYGNWIVPVFKLLSYLPFYAAYLVWAALSIAAVFFAARVFGGNGALALLSYQMLYSLYYGQITGVLAGGLALFWWGTANRRHGWAGLGLLIAASKFQSGLMFAALLWLFAEMPWRDRLKTLLVPCAGVLLSLVIYPGWPVDLLQRLQANPANADASISLWRWIGPWALLVFIPPLVLRLPRWTRFILLVAAIPLALPYFQQADLLEMFVLPVGGWAVLAGNLGFTYIRWGWAALQWLFVVPAGVYLWAIANCFIPPLTRRRAHADAGLEKPV